MSALEEALKALDKKNSGLGKALEALEKKSQACLDHVIAEYLAEKRAAANMYESFTRYLEQHASVRMSEGLGLLEVHKRRREQRREQRRAAGRRPYV